MIVSFLWKVYSYWLTGVGKNWIWFFCSINDWCWTCFGGLGYWYFVSASFYFDFLGDWSSDLLFFRISFSEETTLIPDFLLDLIDCLILLLCEWSSGYTYGLFFNELPSNLDSRTYDYLFWIALTSIVVFPSTSFSSLCFTYLFIIDDGICSS